MTALQIKNPKKCFACLKKAATRNAILAAALSGSFLAFAIFVYQMS